MICAKSLLCCSKDPEYYLYNLYLQKVSLTYLPYKNANHFLLHRFQRPPGAIPSSYVGLEAFTGTMEEFGFEDYLNGKEVPREFTILIMELFSLKFLSRWYWVLTTITGQIYPLIV